MKRLLIFAATIFSLSLSAQNKTPTTGTYALYTQLWNPLSVYFGTVTSSTQLGVQLDTVVNVATLLLESSTFWYAPSGSLAPYTIGGEGKQPKIPVVFNTYVNNDTVIVSPLDGWFGSLTLTTAVYKCTGTDTVIVTPYESSDGIIWAPIPGATAGSTLAVTIEPTSLTVPVVVKWPFTVKPDKFIGVQISNQKTSSTVSARAWIYGSRPYILGSTN